MNAWLALGIFLMGAGIGALLTFIAQTTRMQRLRTEIRVLQNTMQTISTNAHDLNNDLGVIAGYCELMAEQTEPGSQTADRLQLSLTAAHRLAKRINGHDCGFARSSERASNTATVAEARH